MRQVCIGRPKELLPEGLTDCVVTGWGRRSESESPSSFQWSTSLGDQRVSDDHQLHYHIYCYRYQKHNSTVLWVDATSKDPLLLLLRQRGTICGFLRDLSSVASVTWLPWWHCHPSRYQHHHRHQDLRKDYQCGMIANIAIKNILTDSEHSVVLKEISVPLWDHDRCVSSYLSLYVYLYLSFGWSNHVS